MDQMELIIWIATMMPFYMTSIFFIVILVLNRRSLWSGFGALCWLFGSGLSLLLVMFRYSQWIMEQKILYALMQLAALAILLILAMFPLLLFTFLIIEGIQLIRKEGFSFTNCLTLGLAFGIVLNVFILCYINPTSHPILGLFASLMTTATSFLSFQLAIFLLSAIVNLIHFGKRKHFDQIVVLGSGLFGDQVPPLLQGRIRKGIKIQKCNPNAFMILSGGQGPGETVPEGRAMKKWALQNGADPDRTICEDQSRNTEENLEFSRKIFPKPNGKTCIVSTYYHVFRALLLSKKMNINALGYGSRTKLYFTINAFLREYIAYLNMTKKRQLMILIILWLPALFVI